MWIRNENGSKWRALFASYAQDLALRDSVRCRDLMRSQWYRETYQPKWEFSKAQDQKGAFANTDKGFRISNRHSVRKYPVPVLSKGHIRS
jgi:hypothetical protein